MLHVRQVWLVAAGLFVFGTRAAWCQGDADSNTPTIQWQPKHVLRFEDRPFALNFSRDGKRFAARDGRSARVWDTRTWKEVRCFTDDKGLLWCVLSPDGRLLAFTSNSADKDIKLLEVASGKVLRRLTGHTDSANWPTFSLDGKTIASTGDVS